MPTYGRGSTANVIAAIASAIVPGLGQLAQARLGGAIFFFLLATILWLICTPIGWLANVLACIDAAIWAPRARRSPRHGFEAW